MWAFFSLYQKVPLTAAEMVDRLSNATAPTGESVDKLQVFRFGFDLGDSFSIWAIAPAMLFFLAIFTSSHGMTQRLLSCRSATHAGFGLVGGYLVGIVSVAMFMGIGLLAYLLNDPAIGGEAAGMFQNPDTVYPTYVRSFFPAGVAGLAVAGLIAAVMSSFDSSVAGVASSLRIDLLGRHGEAGAPWRTTLASGAVLTLFGLIAVTAYESDEAHLLDFVLGLGSFPLGALLGVFTCGVLTRRGTGTSATLALIAGAAAWLVMWWGEWTAWPYWIAAATLASFTVCALGGRRAS
jgi:Na+/proline symporter